MTPTINGNTYSAQVEASGVSYNEAHLLTVLATDKLSTAQASDTIKRGVPVFDWGESDFAFHVPISIEDNPLADYIVDSGTTAKTGIAWQWVKYKSGLAICWGLTDLATVDVTSAWGNIYTSSPSGAGTYALPFTFASRCCVAAPQYQTGDYWLMTWKSGDGTTETPGYQLARGTAKTQLSYRLSLFVIGMLAK